MGYADEKASFLRRAEKKMPRLWFGFAPSVLISSWLTQSWAAGGVVSKQNATESIKTRKNKLYQSIMSLTLSTAVCLVITIVTVYKDPGFGIDPYRNHSKYLIDPKTLAGEYHLRQVFHTILMCGAMPATVGFMLSAYLMIGQHNIETEDEWEIYFRKLGFAYKIPYYCFTVQLYSFPVATIFWYYLKYAEVGYILAPILCFVLLVIEAARSRVVHAVLCVRLYRKLYYDAFRNETSGATENEVEDEIALSGKEIGEYLVTYIAGIGGNIMNADRTQWSVWLKAKTLASKNGKKLSTNGLMLARKVYDKVLELKLEEELYDAFIEEDSRPVVAEVEDSDSD